MAGSTSSINDRDFDLLKKTAWNWYSFATGLGITGTNPPSINDTTLTLLKKIAYYTAACADN